ncbi:MAG: hypothetical protein ABEI99_03560 [Halobaculum sp.]
MTNSDGGTPEVFCDTSVLLAYVFDHELSAEQLVTGDSRTVVVSETVESEFTRVPERRDDIYDDFISMIQSDESVAIDIADGRSYFTSNDQEFVENLRRRVTDAESPAEQLRILRERQRLATRRIDTVNDQIARTCDRNDDLDLLMALGTVVMNEDDCQVLADAALWSREGGPGDLATRDYRDMIDNAAGINREIETTYDEEGTLQIDTPREFI